MKFFAAQRIFSMLIVLALIAGTPVRIAFSGSTGSLASICAGTQVSTKGCCNECGDKGLSIDTCAPQCAAFVALPAIDRAVSKPWPLTASDALLPSARLWSAETDTPPPKRLSHA